MVSGIGPWVGMGAPSLGGSELVPVESLCFSPTARQTLGPVLFLLGPVTALVILSDFNSRFWERGVQGISTVSVSSTSDMDILYVPTFSVPPLKAAI